MLRLNLHNFHEPISCLRSVQINYFIVSFFSIPPESFHTWKSTMRYNKQLLDEVEHDIMNYQSRGLSYLPKPKAEADNTDTRVS